MMCQPHTFWEWSGLVLYFIITLIDFKMGRSEKTKANSILEALLVGVGFIAQYEWRKIKNEYQPNSTSSSN